MYPSGITINKIYDNNGYLSEIWHGGNMLWKLNSSNGRGQPVNYNLGNISNNLQVSFTYDAQGRVSGITTGQKKQTYYFDPASGNLMSRDYRLVNSQTGLTEVFEYDSLNRLVKSKVTGVDSIVVDYADNGNILSKSDAGNYTYHASKVNAVAALSGNPSTVSLTAQEISYNTFNLTTDITEGDSTYQIIYNPLNQRIKTIYSPDNGATVTTRYYSGGYEKTTAGGVTKELHYISGPSGLVAIIAKQGQLVQTYYVETDHLGSIIGLINADKSYADSASFDPWGKRRNPADWSYDNVPAPQITDRGFTGHEHLDAFGLINMNGRMYDPVVARFLGVDPVIPDPSTSQSFNGYSYCLNNPLIYTDPTGFVADGLTIYDLVNNLWNSGGGYWSSRNPDYFLPYYHDYDPYEGSLLEYSVVHFLNGSQSSGPGGGGGEGRVYYSKSKDEYGYWSKTTVESSGIRYVKPGRYIDGYIGYGIWNISVSSKWIGINFPHAGFFESFMKGIDQMTSPQGDVIFNLYDEFIPAFEGISKYTSALGIIGNQVSYATGRINASKYWYNNLMNGQGIYCSAIGGTAGGIIIAPSVIFYESAFEFVKEQYINLENFLRYENFIPRYWSGR